MMTFSFSGGWRVPTFAITFMIRLDWVSNTYQRRTTQPSGSN